MKPGDGDLRLLGRIFRQARPGAWLVLGILCIDLLATPLALLAPVPLQIAVDSLVGDEPAPGALTFLAGDSRSALLLSTAALLVAITCLTQLQSMGASLLRTYVGERLTLAFRSRLFRHVQRISFTYHDQHGTMDPTYRIQKDSEAVKNLVVEGVVPFVGAAFLLATTLYVILRIDWQLALIALAVAPVLFWLARTYKPRLRRRSREARKLETDALSVIQEVLTSLRVVKAFAQERREEERFVERSKEGMRARLSIAWAEGGLGLLIGLTTALGAAAVLVVGVRNVQAGTLTLGTLLLVISYLNSIYSPLKTISRKFASIQTHLASAERAFGLLDVAPDVEDRPGARTLRRARGAFVFEGVSFAYPGNPQVLCDVSFRVDAGTRVGLAGETGSGKTTLAGLLLRFHDPSAGRILLDGVDLRELRLADLREQFSLVPQDPVLFSTSVEENIAYARPQASHDQVVAAAKAANAHEFICALPEGYGTRVGERGMRLSGGERQRVAIARAFLKDAPILVLDEPTSALDPDTESAVLEAMARLMEKRTTLIIAHRPTTLEACDQVLVLRDGAMVSTLGAAS
jgi:ATP-binding cassette subfamily B protein